MKKAGTIVLLCLLCCVRSSKNSEYKQRASTTTLNRLTYPQQSASLFYFIALPPIYFLA